MSNKNKWMLTMFAGCVMSAIMLALAMNSRAYEQEEKPRLSDYSDKVISADRLVAVAGKDYIIATVKYAGVSLFELSEETDCSLRTLQESNPAFTDQTLMPGEEVLVPVWCIGHPVELRQ